MSEKPTTWRKTGWEKIAECRVFNVWRNRFVNSKSGAEADFFTIENPDWVKVIALTWDEKVILVEQFRFGVERVSLETPSGIIEPGEDPQAAALRELREETGYEPKQIVSLGKVAVNPAIQSNKTHFFLALDCEPKYSTSFDEHEDIAARFVALAEIPQLIETGQIAHSLVVAGFYRYNLYRQREAEAGR